MRFEEYWKDLISSRNKNRRRLECVVNQLAHGLVYSLLTKIPPSSVGQMQAVIVFIFNSKGEQK